MRLPAFTVSPWIGVGAVLLGVFILVGAVRTVSAGRRRQRSWVRRDGRVVASRLQDGSFRYQVAYSDGAGEVRFWNRFTSGSGIDPVGREVVVLVDPTDPQNAVVVRGAAGSGTAGAAFAVFGLLVTAVGVYLLTHSR